MNIVVIGTTYVDIKGFPVGNYVPTGRNVGTIEQFHGGVARNIAEDIANLDEQVTFVSLVDRGGIGMDVIDHLDEIGIRTDTIYRTKDGMGQWLAIFDENGEVSANVSGRPNLLPICDILDEKGDDVFSKADGILLEVDIDEVIVAKTFALAEKYKKHVYCVISNMNIAKERLPYIRKARLLVCNKQETGILFDKDTLSLRPEEILSLMKEEQKKLGIGCLISTLDAEGAAYSDFVTGEEGLCEARKVDVKDTTGAGDSFFAGVSVGLIRGLSFKEACELGIAIASEVIQTDENVYHGQKA